jgi:transposase-like protein
LYAKEGKTIREVANALGCSFELVRKKCHEFGISMRDRGINKIEIDKKALHRLYAKKGKSYAEIAKIFGCSASLISLRIRQFGLKKRKGR